MRARIYFISDGCGSVKIGITADVSRRLGNLSSANPGTLVLLGEVQGDRSQERQLHCALADYRVSGEWFRDCETVRALIDQVIAVGLDAAGFSSHAREEANHFTVSEARELAEIIVRASGVRVTDSGETFGVPNTLLWRMRYRPGRRVFADEWHLLAEGAARASAHAAEAAQRDAETAQRMLRRRSERFLRATPASAVTGPLKDHRDLPLWRALDEGE